MKNVFVKIIFCVWIVIRFCFPYNDLLAKAPDNHREKQIGLLKSKIQQFVLNGTATDDSIQIELNSVPNVLFTVMDASITVSSRKQGPINGKTIFKIYYQKEQDLKDYCQVVATVKRYSSVFVLNQSINRNHIIRESDLTFAVQEVNWPDTETPVGIKDAVGKRVKRRIQKGRVLTHTMLEAVPLIERGKSLNMDVNLKNVLITLPVISHGKGQKGDIIKVRNTTTGIYYLAEIKNNNTVIYKSNKR